VKVLTSALHIAAILILATAVWRGTGKIAKVFREAINARLDSDQWLQDRFAEDDACVMDETAMAVLRSDRANGWLIEITDGTTFVLGEGGVCIAKADDPAKAFLTAAVADADEEDDNHNNNGHWRR
jgi:hypothetical protein